MLDFWQCVKEMHHLNISPRWSLLISNTDFISQVAEMSLLKFWNSFSSCALEPSAWVAGEMWLMDHLAHIVDILCDKTFTFTFCLPIFDLLIFPQFKPRIVWWSFMLLQLCVSLLLFIRALMRMRQAVVFCWKATHIDVPLKVMQSVWSCATSIFPQPLVSIALSTFWVCKAHKRQRREQYLARTRVVKGKWLYSFFSVPVVTSL